VFSERLDDFAIARYEGFPGDAQVPSFDICLQDETTGDVLRVNSQTHDYQFVRCGTQGFMLTGRAKLKLKKQGCAIKLTNSLNDRDVIASINVCKKRLGGGQNYRDGPDVHDNRQRYDE